MADEAKVVADAWVMGSIQAKPGMPQQPRR